MRLRQVARLRRLDRLNTAAIRRELGAAEQTAGPRRWETDADLGRRLRTLRTEQRLSLTAAAKRSGLSMSFLSAVARGQSSISVGNLFKLADAYGTTVPGLSLNHRAGPRGLLRPEDRPRAVAGRGLVVIEDLIASPRALEARRIEILPGGGSEEAYAHPGEEFVFVLAGELRFAIAEREHYELCAGDSRYFRSTEAHRWRNDGAEPVAVLWINVPVVEPADADGAGRGAARHRPVDHG
jgi:transcriptional regulator with XRE-family HTH domain